MTDIATAADNAADYLEKHGHRKHDVGFVGTSACIRGALAWSNGVQGIMDFRNEDDKTVVAIADHLGIEAGFIDRWQKVEQWNNDFERTPTEVIQVLRDVATKYRSDEFRSAS